MEVILKQDIKELGKKDSLVKEMSNTEKMHCGKAINIQKKI